MKLLAHHVAHIWVHKSNETKRLCAYWDNVVRGDVMDRDMSFHIKLTAAKLGYPNRNVPLDRIDTNSNRAGGACTIKLTRFYDESITRMVRWLPSSNAFLEYN